jgi:hypothetical protein
MCLSWEAAKLQNYTKRWLMLLRYDLEGRKPELSKLLIRTDQISPCSEVGVLVK